MYLSQYSVYGVELHKFLHNTEMENIKKLHFVAGSNEKEFWNLVKDRGSSFQMSTFQLMAPCATMGIRFETCGLTILISFSQSDFHDSNLLNLITGCVKEIF